MIKTLSALLVGVSLLVLPTQAEETLTFATASPPQGPISTVIFDGWAQRINADGEGIVQIDVQHGFTVAGPAVGRLSPCFRRSTVITASPFPCSCVGNMSLPGGADF